MTLTEFLLARITEDERDAQYAETQWSSVPSTKRILAECEAKRRIVTEAGDYSPELAEGDNGEWAFGTVLRMLALPYANHPDYQPEWRP